MFLYNEFFAFRITAYFAEEKKAGKSIKNLDAIVMISDNKEFLDFLDDVIEYMTKNDKTADKIKALLKGNQMISYK